MIIDLKMLTKEQKKQLFEEMKKEEAEEEKRKIEIRKDNESLTAEAIKEMRNELIEEFGENAINANYFEIKVEELARLKIERNEAKENISKGFDIEENRNKYFKSFSRTKEIMRELERELL